jgi:hypothetical protein
VQREPLGETVRGDLSSVPNPEALEGSARG